MTDVRSHANLVWGIAELLRGSYKQADYGQMDDRLHEAIEAPTPPCARVVLEVTP